MPWFHLNSPRYAASLPPGIRPARSQNRRFRPPRRLRSFQPEGNALCQTIMRPLLVRFYKNIDVSVIITPFARKVNRLKAGFREEIREEIRMKPRRCKNTAVPWHRKLRCRGTVLGTPSGLGFKHRHRAGRRLPRIAEPGNHRFRNLRGRRDDMTGRDGARPLHMRFRRRDR